MPLVVKGPDQRGIEVSPGKAGADGALKLITGDDLRDFKKDRHIRVAQLHYIEQRLLLPGIRDRAGVIDPVANHGRRANAAARREQEP